MLEMGARFTNNMYVKLSMDVESADCFVTFIANVEGIEYIRTGTVTWDDVEE